MHHYPHHIGDFIKETARLTDAQAMAYLRLQWQYLGDEQAIKNDVDAVAFKIGATAYDVHQIFKAFFTLDTESNRWKHERCEKVLAEFYDNSEKARAKAQKRWNRCESEQVNSCSNATASKTDATETKTDATQYPIPNTKERSKERARRGSRLPPDFEFPDDWIDHAKTEHPSLDWRTESKRFKNYWAAESGAKACKLDWFATWRNWLLKAKDFAPTARGSPITSASKTAVAIANLEGHKRGIGTATAGTASPNSGRVIGSESERARSDDQHWIPAATLPFVGESTGFGHHSGDAGGMDAITQLLVRTG